LRRLATDTIDLYWLHAWDMLTPIEKVMRALDDQVRAGKILYAGVSDMPAWKVAQANTLATLRGWTPFIGLQVEYSLIERNGRARADPDGPRPGAGPDPLVAAGRGILTVNIIR